MEWADIHYVVDTSIKKALDDFKHNDTNLWDFMIAMRKTGVTLGWYKKVLRQPIKP